MLAEITLVNWKVKVDRELPGNPDGQIHINILCPKCGAEITELDFNRKKSGNSDIWECFRKCPECGNEIELKNY